MIRKQKGRDLKVYAYLKLAIKPAVLSVTTMISADEAAYSGPYPDFKVAQTLSDLLEGLKPLLGTDQWLQNCHVFLAGDYQPLQMLLTQRMQQEATKLNFELAATYRNHWQKLATLIEQQHWVATKVSQDAFGYAVKGNQICLTTLFIRQESIQQRTAVTVKLQTSIEQTMKAYLTRFYQQKNHLTPTNVLLPKELTLATDREHNWQQPEHGFQRGAVLLAIKFAQSQVVTAKLDGQQAVRDLGTALGIPAPTRIEAFDNSNLQGADLVSAMVVFEHGRPLKSNYRKYKIKTVIGQDDYAAMREVIYRRYSRLLKTGSRLPDLILIDGGPGQVTAAQGVLEDQLGLLISVAGMVKDQHHRTDHLLFSGQIVPLEKTSLAFRLLTQIQNEVHRFVITYFRQRHEKSGFASLLDTVPGIGPKRKQVLLRQFGAIEQIAAAPVAELVKLGIPTAVAENLNKVLSQANLD
ncbi:helix-hairpin-helix domain-containing protein [Loigolactobacillus backii]|uniref:helix-hairpin-helix domain-containing protein n=1 Tax=Loigolactobacillus backii TaxID=375175 RepID=UPI0022FD6D12|nr:helix-hairpin-helix domain-containing protein [Loigolactobacillus backii]MDA5388034.1 excinuclease ABC subunit C [Loigolactobacillus backii]MDA5390519.1 excinuclease ABC subunit C [Loigolactobacillus backii]